MARMICLANSHKHNERCIAGIDYNSGNWIRPVYENSPTSGICWEHRKIDKSEPSLLDIIDINISNVGPDIGFQPENRTLLTGAWVRISSISPKYVMRYFEKTPQLLHSNTKRVDPVIFKNMHRNRWKSLQLVYAKNALLHINRYNSPDACFDYNGTNYCLKITDPIYEAKLRKNGTVNMDCILTISLGGAFKATCDDKPYHYKMIAGVIEL